METDSATPAAPALIDHGTAGVAMDVYAEEETATALPAPHAEELAIEGVGVIRPMRLVYTVH
eukprot:6134175-Heterocapsa_arctica.AAC.1